MLDLKGKVFNRLLVVSPTGRTVRTGKLWKCLCLCGKHTEVTAAQLRSNKTKSCGCLQRERTSRKNTKHGSSGTSLYERWSSLKKRCRNKNDADYKYYGARGITVCDEWNSFLNFKEWALANGYHSHLSIDRINNNEGYMPENCRWVTHAVQMSNTRRQSSSTTP